MTWKRHPGADLAEKSAQNRVLVQLLQRLTPDLEVNEASVYVYTAIADYDRARRSEDELRQHLQACVLLLSEGAELVVSPTIASESGYRESMRFADAAKQVIAAVAQLSRRTDGQE